MTGLLTLVLLETEPLIDPNVAKPGWTPLLVSALLMLALTFLFFSMRKQIRKIQIPRSDPDGDAGADLGPDAGSATGDRASQPEPGEKATRPDPR